MRILIPGLGRLTSDGVDCVALFMALSLAVATTSDFAAATQPEGSALSTGRSVISNGGGTSVGGGFAISGTIGQPDAEPLQPSTGGIYSIAGGFWPGADPPLQDSLFADGFD